MATKQAVIAQQDGATNGSRRAARAESVPEEPIAAPEQSAQVPDDTQESTPLDSSKRRMPDKFRRFLLKVQGGKYYLPAAYRIVWFRDECPDWGVATIITEGGQEAGFATVQATVYNPDGRVVATGHKTETRQDFPAGWVEKAETGAIARALAVAGFGTQFSPELDEEPLADSPQPIGGQPVRYERPLPGPMRAAPGPPRDDGDKRVGAAVGEVWEGPGQCPRCHAPAGKRHGKPCAV